ncbi:hypothetical protein GTP55_24500 [Duganella sp. FT109W]|uniref:DUF1640 domain-containing protein n=1 Tax=Duganella margarita TaxID=2692170 RepID=A0A7X4H375_9BURK|nr:hypothetical protein [Duganella margarita]MYM74488.1 hypothetical protein [Duganella margarita]MYN42506.1 hypothetical protein [Duganella margarita]
MSNNFNMVAFMDTLVEGGFSQQQAKALAVALFQLIESHLVTKEYLDLRLSELQTGLRAEFREGLSSLKAELIQWLCGILIVQTGATAVLFKFLH